MPGLLRWLAAQLYYTQHMNTVMTYKTTSTDSANTERLGQLVGQQLSPPALVELSADLGGGKTSFVRGLVKGLKSSSNVSSPTFTLNKIYKIPSGEVHHYDFYRLSEAGLVGEQLAESLSDPKVITVVEWSDIVQDVLPDQRLSIKFEPTANDPDERAITFTYPESLTHIIKELEQQWNVSRA